VIGWMILEPVPIPGVVLVVGGRGGGARAVHRVIDRMFAD
jgi:hypothetical protein